MYRRAAFFTAEENYSVDIDVEQFDDQFVANVVCKVGGNEVINRTLTCDNSDGQGDENVGNFVTRVTKEFANFRINPEIELK